MAIKKLTDDLNIIAKLDDEPNDVGGLTPGELKAAFDSAGNKIKSFINESLIFDIEGGEGGDGGLVGEKITEHNADETAHPFIQQKITSDIGSHNVAPDAHADIRQDIVDDLNAHNENPSAHPSTVKRIDNVEMRTEGLEEYTGQLERKIDMVGSRVQSNEGLIYSHTGDLNNPHKVTAEQIGALKAIPQATATELGGVKAEPKTPAQTEPVGIDASGKLFTAPPTDVVADCFDEAASPTSQPNTWYVPKTAPRPSGAVGMTVDVRWANGRVDGLGYNVSLVWGAPGGADNETIVAPISTVDNLTGEYSIPAEGTIRYQLEEKDGRQHWRYVSGKLLPKQFSTATAAATADKLVPGMDIEYLPGMDIYVQLDNGNTADVMRIVPDSGPTLPVYGNGTGNKTGTLPAGYIGHLVNAGDHWQIVNGGSGGGSVDKVVEFSTTEPADKNVIWANPNDSTVPGGGGGADEGVYELIEKFTTTEEAVVSRTKEPDGTPYNFKRVQVKVKLAEAHDFSIYAETNGRAIIGYGAMKQSESRRFMRYSAYLENGYFDCETATQRALSAQTDYFGNAFDRMNRWPAVIKGVPQHIAKIASNGVTPSGAEIEIWAVRA